MKLSSKDVLVSLIEEVVHNLLGIGVFKLLIFHELWFGYSARDTYANLVNSWRQMFDLRPSFLFMLCLESLTKRHAWVGIPQCTLLVLVLGVEAISVCKSGQLDKNSSFYLPPCTLALFSATSRVISLDRSLVIWFLGWTAFLRLWLFHFFLSATGGLI